jgi:hypothetical protein
MVLGILVILNPYSTTSKATNMKTSAPTFLILILMSLSLISFVAVAIGQEPEHVLTSEEKVN